MSEPILNEVKNGWLARGGGWAVRGSTREEALQKFRDAEDLREKIRTQPFFYERQGMVIEVNPNEVNPNLEKNLNLRT